MVDNFHLTAFFGAWITVAHMSIVWNFFCMFEGMYLNVSKCLIKPLRSLIVVVKFLLLIFSFMVKLFLFFSSCFCIAFILYTFSLTAVSFWNYAGWHNALATSLNCDKINKCQSCLHKKCLYYIQYIDILASLVQMKVI